jgi:hypothetical protein
VAQAGVDQLEGALKSIGLAMQVMGKHSRQGKWRPGTAGVDLWWLGWGWLGCGQENACVAVPMHNDNVGRA